MNAYMQCMHKGKDDMIRSQEGENSFCTISKWELKKQIMYSSDYLETVLTGHLFFFLIHFLSGKNISINKSL